jgi:hypothetical protein
VKLNDVDTPNATDATPNPTDNTGGATTTSDELAVLPVAPLTEATVTEFVIAPAVTAVTSTEKLHDAWTATRPPVNVTVVDPTGALTAPGGHEPVTPLGSATFKPAGKESTKPTPVNIAALTAGLSIMKVSDVD